MKKVLSLLVLSMFVIGGSVPAFADTTENSRPQPPQFENGKQSQMNGQNNQNGQFNGRRPKYKPDSQPGGKMEPQEWSSSSDGNYQGGQPPQMKEGFNNGLKDDSTN